MGVLQFKDSEFLNNVILWYDSSGSNGNIELYNSKTLNNDGGVLWRLSPVYY